MASEERKHHRGVWVAAGILERLLWRAGGLRTPLLWRAKSACTVVASGERREAARAVTVAGGERKYRRGVRKAERGCWGRCYGKLVAHASTWCVGARKRLFVLILWRARSTCTIGHVEGNRRLMAPIPNERRAHAPSWQAKNSKELVGPILGQAGSVWTVVACEEQREAAGAIPMVSEERVHQRDMQRAAGGLRGPLLWRAPEGAKAIVAYGERRGLLGPLLWRVKSAYVYMIDVPKLKIRIPPCTCRIIVYWFDDITSRHAGRACAIEASERQQRTAGDILLQAKSVCTIVACEENAIGCWHC